MSGRGSGYQDRRLRETRIRGRGRGTGTRGLASGWLGNQYALQMSMSGTTCDFKLGTMDPTSRLDPGGDYAAFDTLERSSAGIRAALAVAPALKVATLDLVIPGASMAPLGLLPYGMGMEITITTLSAHNDTGVQHSLYSHATLASAREGFYVLVDYSGGNRRIVHNIKRANAWIGGTAANWAGYTNQARIMTMRSDERLETLCYETTPKTLTEPADIAVAPPASYDDGASYQMAFIVQPGATLDVLISKVWLYGIPIL